MRILHVITDADRRGAQVYATDLSGGLRELGCESDVVALAPGRHGIPLDVDCLGPARYDLRTWRNLRRRAGTYDCVVAHGSSTLVSSAVALAGAGVPFIYRQISDPLHWAASPFRRARVAFYLRRTAAIVALSQGAAEVLVRHYRLRRNRIRVIPNAVPENGFGSDPRQAAVLRKQIGAATDDCVCLYLGALVLEKGVDIAISTTGATSRMHLVVVGDGPARTELERLAAHVAPGRVHFLGSSDRPSEVLSAVDMLLLPSRAGDSMPAVVIEAGLSSLPCVTTPVGSITDVVVDGSTGIVTPIGDQQAFDDAVGALSVDVERREQLGAAARERCLQRFTIATTAGDWKTLIENALGS